METVFSFGSAQRIYNEDSRPAERRELRESLEMAVEDDCEEMTRKELVYEKKTSCVL
jgi:hypothetical protein